MVDLADYPAEVAIVTGAGRGIGLEIGRALASSGRATVLVDIDGHLAERQAAQLVAEGLVALGVAADVSNVEQVRDVIDRTLTEWQRVDILVNNAGICPITSLREIAVSEWDSVLDVNLKGAFLFSQAVAPHMLQQQSGRIVNVASSAGQMGGLAVGLHYTASKAGLLGLTKGLARTLAPFVQVNAVSPGTTESEMTAAWDEETIESIVGKIPANRLGRPSDVAAAVLFLVSAGAAYITGQTLSVNGGMLMV